MILCKMARDSAPARSVASKNGMDSLASVFFVVALVLYFVAYVRSVVAVSRDNAILGLICLLVPLAALIVVVRRWPESRRLVALWAIASLCLLVGVLLSPSAGARS